MQKIAKFFEKTMFTAAAVVFFAFGALFVSCSDGGGSGGSSVSLKSISLDVTDVKTAYISGEDAFTAEGLKVTALYSDKSKKEISAGEYTVTGYEKYADAEGVLSLTGDANYVSVKITVEYNGQKASYSIVISKPVSRITVDVSNAVTDFFTDDEISLEAVELAEDDEEQAAGFIVRAFYLNEGDEGYAEEAGEVVTTGVSFTAVDNSVSGTTDVKASYLGKESEGFAVNVYRISGTVASEYEKGDAVPSLDGIKVYLGEEEVTGAKAVLKDSEGNEYAESVFKVGTYSLIVTAGTAEKTFAEITVNRPDAEKFAVISDESKIEGAALQIRIDASDMNVKWADNLESVKPEITLSDGTVSPDPGAFFTAPAVNADTGIVEKFTIQIVLTSPVSTTVADVSADIAGTKYKATVRFVNGSCIPSDYVPSSLVLDKTSVELPCAATTTFKVTDGKYGLDYSSDVTWSLENDSTGSSIEGGLFTAGTVDELSTVTVRASLKANPSVYAEASVTINPDKDDVSSIYDARIYNEENNGAWFHGELSWDDSQYKIVEITSKSAGIQSIINVTPAEDKTTFMINLTSGEYRGVQKTFVFRVKTEKGAYYDVSVTYTDSNVTAGGSTTSIDDVSVEEAVLNPKLILAKENVEVQKDGDAVHVAVSYEEIADFDASKLSAVSDNADVEVSVEGTTLLITGKGSGNAVVTVKYDNSETVKASVAVTVVEELSPFEVEIITNDGAWFKIKVAYNDEAHKINVDNAVLTNVHMSLDGDSNADVSYCNQEENAVVFARSFGAANMTAAVEQTLTFRIETASGEKYDFTVVFTGGKGLTITPTSTEFVAVKELVLSSEKLTFETLTEQTVTVSQVGIADFDLSSVTVSSDSESVATAAISDGTITVAPVADGKANITVTFGDYSKTIAVTVQTSLEEVELTFKSTSKIEGAGLVIYWNNTLSAAPSSDSLVISVVFDGGTNYKNYEAQLTKDDYKPIWCNAEGLHFTVPAGFSNGDDFTHSVTITFVQDGKKYSGTAVFKGNALVTE
jgi:hypothetical protein